MRYILDSSVAFKWVVLETDSIKARQLRADYEYGIHELIAPDIFPFEIAHALTRAERQGRIMVGEAIVEWATILTTSPVYLPAFPLLTRGIEIASSARIGVYDCLYVALAEQEGCELITADMRLVKNLKSQFPYIISLDSLP